MFQPKLLLVLAALATMPFWSDWAERCLPNLSEQDEFLVSTDEIEITTPPHWVPHDLVDQVAHGGRLPDRMSLLAPDLTDRVAAAFRRHPWVAEVVEVRRQSSPPRLSVSLAYRTPVCMIEKRDGLYPVSEEGILLPTKDFSLAETAHYLRVLDVRSLPSGAEGTGWGDPTVVGASRLAGALRDCWKRLGVAAIRVPPRTKAEIALEDLTFELLTTGGSTILWGRAPDIDHPGELSVEQKIGRLEKYLADYGSFDEPAGPYEIDIRHWQQISRRRLNSTQDARRGTTPRR